MYQLFDLIKLISVKQQNEMLLKTKADIVKVACREFKEHFFLALVCSNDYILLRHCVSGCIPAVRQIPWSQEQPIEDLCFDDTATWLLVLTRPAQLHIIPALSLMAPSASVIQLWRLDDATSITINPPLPDPVLVCWWHTSNDHHVAIIGTKTGDLAFVDLRRQIVATRCSVSKSPISELSFIEHDDQSCTQLLVTCRDGSMWKLLLEAQSNGSVTQVQYDQAADDLGYDNIAPSHPPVISILHKTEDSILFRPERYLTLTRSISVTQQEIQGRHFLAELDVKTSICQIYSSSTNVQATKLSYKVPTGVHSVVLTDRLIFALTNLGGKKLTVIANQKAEKAVNQDQELSKDAVLQQFDLPADEYILRIAKKHFPFYWHEKQEEDERIRNQLSFNLSCDQNDMSNADVGSSSSTASASSVSSCSDDGAYDIPVVSHTVLNGCLIVTNATVYECRPRVSPERLFLDLALRYPEQSRSEQLAYNLGLDGNTLFELAAEYKLDHGKVAQAVRLYQLSKCSYVRRVANFAQHGCISEVLIYITQSLAVQSSDLALHELKQLSDMAIHCYLYQIKHQSKDSQASYIQTFRGFLQKSFYYNERMTLELLAASQMTDLLLEVARSHGLVMEALELLWRQGNVQLNREEAETLVSKGFGAHLSRVGQGVFLRCLRPGDLSDLLCMKPTLALDNLELLSDVLPSLNEEQLLQLATIFDPSNQPVKGFILRSMRVRTRTVSIGSLYSLAGDMAEAQKLERKAFDVSRLIQFFLSVVVVLASKRLFSHPISLKDLLPADVTAELTISDSSDNNKSKPKQVQIACCPSPAGCGSSHTALLRNGSLYTCGKSHMGRLGHGENIQDMAHCLLARVDSLNQLQIQVISVSCGGEHTLALTQQGVFAWGSSRFGQVGVGVSSQNYSRPMLVEGLLDVPCVAVACGQYHSLALTVHGEVYSWGWGVHGQLGHGNAEDYSSPMLISHLVNNNIQVQQITAGYCHSVVLSTQGDIYTFGCGLFGQLGHGSSQKISTPQKMDNLPEPIRLVATGYFHNIAVSKSNRVISWGCHPYTLRQTAHAFRRQRHAGNSGPACHGTDYLNSFLGPTEVDKTLVNGNIIQVSCGSFHNVLLNSDGEVYMWGKNHDGQLGTNNKHDLKIPNMLTSINDRSIAHIECGGDYTVAIDTDGLVWVWGKNDCGQLGIEKKEMSAKLINPVHSMIGRKGHSAMMNCIAQPTILQALPPLAAPLSFQQVVRSISVESMELDQGIDDGDPEFTLPDLEHYGPEPYHASILLVVLKLLGDKCNILKLRRLCIDLGVWLSAADLYTHQENYAQGLSCHLRTLHSCRVSLLESDDDFSTTCVQVIKHYLRLILKMTSPQERRLSIRHALLEVFWFWDESGLDIDTLQTLLGQYMTDVADILGLLLFKEDSSAEFNKGNDAEEGTTVLLCIPAALKSKFTTKFHLQVLRIILKQIETGTDVANTVFSSLFEQFIKPDNLDNKDIKLLDKSEQVIPVEKLWHEIVQNLQKDWDVKNYIVLTPRQIDQLQEHVTLYERQSQFSLKSKNLSAESNPVVAFTCGHSFTIDQFRQNISSTFRHDLGGNSCPLPQSASLLKTVCQREEGLIPMACPKCVRAALESAD